jgi:hypothetical protein
VIRRRDRGMQDLPSNPKNGTPAQARQTNQPQDPMPSEPRPGYGICTGCGHRVRVRGDRPLCAGCYKLHQREIGRSMTEDQKEGRLEWWNQFWAIHRRFQGHYDGSGFTTGECTDGSRSKRRIR